MDNLKQTIKNKFQFLKVNLLCKNAVKVVSLADF